MIPLLAAGGAGLNVLKGIFDNEETKGQNNVPITQTRYGTFTGWGPGKLKDKKNLLLAGLEGGLTGLSVGSGLEQLANSSKIAEALGGAAKVAAPVASAAQEAVSGGPLGLGLEKSPWGLMKEQASPSFLGSETNFGAGPNLMDYDQLYNAPMAPGMSYGDVGMRTRRNSWMPRI
jgi:hypothetical protein